MYPLIAKTFYKYRKHMAESQEAPAEILQKLEPMLDENMKSEL